jgi:hypothetical protein
MGFKRHLVLPVALTVMAAAAAAPAQAAVLSKGPFTFEESTTEDICGLEVRYDFAVSGHFRNRTGKGDLDQAFFGQSSAHFADTFTNLANGAWFTVDGRTTEMDVKATPLGDDIFEFTLKESGISVVRDMDGNVVLRDTGAIWTLQVFDTLGDSRPGGNILDESVLRVSGPHPGFEQDEAAFCATVHDLIG